VPIPKKGGDPVDPTSYRGIALIDSVVKLLSTTAKAALTDVFDNKDYIVPEQAGFRRGEECISQVVALFELCMRRRNAKLTTALAFIDFKQAFDRVAHPGIHAVLFRLGIRGNLASFFRTLYNSSTLRVRFADGSLSNPIDIKVGVRQGSPDSPDLFILFINDLLEHIHEATNGRSALHVPSTAKRWKGFLFADDTLVASGTPADLIRVLLALQGWCEARDMIPNPKKCGILVVAPTDEARATFTIQLSNLHPTLQGEAVPILDKYTYLGVPFTHDLCLKTILLDRHTKGLASLHSIRPVLHNTSVPLATKADLIRGILISTLLYGAELWGHNGTLTHVITPILTQALRLACGMNTTSTLCSSDVLLRELGIAPLQVQAAYRAVRLYNQRTQKRTWIGILAARTDTLYRTNTWLSATERLIKRLQKRGIPTDSHDTYRSSLATLGG
jgi:hypothetical protein